MRCQVWDINLHASSMICQESDIKYHVSIISCQVSDIMCLISSELYQVFESESDM